MWVSLRKLSHGSQCSKPTLSCTQGYEGSLRMILSGLSICLVVYDRYNIFINLLLWCIPLALVAYRYLFHPSVIQQILALSISLELGYGLVIFSEDQQWTVVVYAIDFILQTSFSSNENLDGKWISTRFASTSLSFPCHFNPRNIIIYSRKYESYRLQSWTRNPSRKTTWIRDVLVFSLSLAYFMCRMYIFTFDSKRESGLNHQRNMVAFLGISKSITSE